MSAFATCISSAHPWCTGDEKQINGFYKRVCADIQRTQRVKSRSEWNNYGSGYASYIDAWFYRATPDFVETASSKDEEAYSGVAVLFAPVALFRRHGREEELARQECELLSADAK